MEVWTALIGGIIIGWLIRMGDRLAILAARLDSLYAAEAKLRDALAKSEAEKAAVLTASAQCATQAG